MEGLDDDHMPPEDCELQHSIALVTDILRFETPHNVWSLGYTHVMVEQALRKDLGLDDTGRRVVLIRMQLKSQAHGNVR